MKKLNNKGFTLVELMVAVVILAVIVSPLLHSFVTSASTAEKARRLGNATLAGKNLAEITEAYSLMDLLENPTGCYGATSFKYGINGESTTFDIAENVQYICLKDVIAGGEAFNARITLDANAYPKQNTVELSEYTSMDSVLAQTKDDPASNPDLLVRDSFITYVKLQHPGWNKNEYTVKREININVKEKSTGGLEAIASFDYVFRYSYDVETEEIGEDGSPVIKTFEDTYHPGPQEYALFPQGFSSTSRDPNIFIMYYPMYDGRTIDGYKVNVETDDINVYNNTDADENLQFTLFLVKQNEDEVTDVEETNYRSTIIQYQESDTSASGASIYSNAGESLLYPGIALSNVHYRINYGSYVSGIGDLAGSELGTLVTKNDKNRMYKVKVDIFKTTDDFTATPIYTFESTKLQ